jgi:hypothetical protein
MPGRRLLLAASSIILIATAAAAAAASPPDPRLGDAWRWSQFTHASGLPSDFVVGVVDIPGDALWAITRSGVARFDGFVWKRIPAKGGTDEGVVAIAPDGHGGVAVVAGTSLFAGNADGLHVVPILDGGKPVEFTNCARAGSGPALLLGKNGVLYEWDGRLATPHLPSGELGRISGIRQAGPTAVWASAEAGLWRWEGTRWRLRFKGRALQWYAVAELADQSALAFVENPRSHRGLWEWRGDTGPTSIRQVVQSAIASIAIGPGGETVIVHNTGDVMLRDGDGWTPLSGPAAAVVEARAVGFLRDGDLWVATDRGLFLHRRSSVLWRAHSLPYPDDRNTVNAIASLPDGRILLGTGRGVTESAIDAPVSSARPMVSYDSGAITGLAVDVRGRVWATSGYSFTGARLRDERGVWRAARLDPTLDRAYLHRVATDSRGGVWFLALSLDPMQPPDRLTDGPGAFRLAVSAAGAPDVVERWGTEQGSRRRPGSAAGTAARGRTSPSVRA